MIRKNITKRAIVVLLGFLVPAVSLSNDLRRVNEDADQALANGKTALMLAAKDNELSQVRSLLAAGADINKVNDNGGTPLMYAALGGNIEIVRMFLDRGARVNATAKNGWSALMIASAKGYAGIVTELLIRGADANLPDVYRWTPLMRGVFENRIDVVKLLLNHTDIDVNRRAENGITALHLAAGNGLAAMVELLLDYGARPDLKDRVGRTPLLLAQQSGHPDLAPLLSPD